MSRKEQQLTKNVTGGHDNRLVTTSIQSDEGSCGTLLQVPS